MLTRGQPVCVVKPILSPEARANLAPLLKESEGQVKQAQEQLKIAKINMDRQENLVRDRLAGAAALVDAKAQYDAAQTAVQAAEERYDEIRKLALDPNAGDQTPYIQGAGQRRAPEPPRADRPARSRRGDPVRRGRDGPDLGQGAGVRG